MVGKALDLFNLSGKIAAVIGGSKGIGFAIAEGLASAGAVIVIGNRRAEEGQEAAGSLQAKGLRVIPIPVDVSERSSVQRMVSEVVKQFGRIDILVNSAAVIQRKPVEEVTDGEWTAMMDVNLRGVFFSCQIAGSQMIKQKQGKIINISSNAVQVLIPQRGIYAVTKAGVSHLTKVMALEWAPYHINVNAIAPAPTATDLNKTFYEEHPEDLKDRIRSIPLGRLGAPEDYVGAALLLASRASDFITGQTIYVDGGSTLL